MPSLERTELGGCRLIRKIGAGAMGEVYLAEQVHLGNRLVAVKVVQVLHDPSLPDESIAGAERHFIREAQLLGQLAHPNILPVYHSGVEAGYLFLVMQYAPDGSLADAINGKGPHRLELPASLPFVADIIGQVASALRYTHEHRVVHADVKPANVLTQVEPDGQWHVLLADFGIAHNRDTVTSRNEVAGTVAYMAPEQFYGQVSPASDQYALAVMAFQLLAGRTPFVGGFLEVAQAHARENPPALSSFNPTVPPAVEAVIARALAKQPRDRYPSVLAFAEALRAAFVDASTILDARTRDAAAALLLPGGPGAGRGGQMPRASLAAARNEPAPAAIPDTLPPTVLATRHDAASAPDTPRSNRNTRRTVTGLAVIALLLVAVVAAIGLRSHIGVSQASSSSTSGVGANANPGQTPARGITGGGSGTGAGSGASKGSGSPPSPPSAVTTPESPTPRATQSAQTPTPTSTATVTPAPTATTGLQPTATVSPTSVPPKATASPPPTAAAGSTPTPPAASAAVTSGPATSAPATSAPATSAPATSAPPASAAQSSQTP